jgi:hypothetical protein
MGQPNGGTPINEIKACFSPRTKKWSMEKSRGVAHE